MANDLNTVKNEAVDAVQKPVDAWRQNIADAHAVAPKSTRHYRALVFQGYLVIAVVAFIVLAFLAKTVAYFTFDVTITQALQTYRPGWFDALMVGLSWIGFAPQVFVIAICICLFLYISGLKWETVVASLSLIGSSLLVTIIKTVIQRPRPAVDLVHVVSQLQSYSFPSGHVLYFTTFFGFLLFLAFTLLKPSRWRTAIIVILGLMILLIGPSRIYDGQHWASDVVAAYLLGSVWLSLSIYIYRWGKPRYFVNQPVAKESPS